MTTTRPGIAPAIIATCLFLDCASRADERRFTYTYEPEVLPKGGLEFEQWVTLRTQRTAGGEVQQENYNLWEFREELEYGVTDKYSVSLYLNTPSRFRQISILFGWKLWDHSRTLLTAPSCHSKENPCWRISPPKCFQLTPTPRQ